MQDIRARLPAAPEQILQYAKKKKKISASHPQKQADPKQQDTDVFETSISLYSWSHNVGGHTLP